MNSTEQELIEHHTKTLVQADSIVRNFIIVTGQRGDENLKENSQGFLTLLAAVYSKIADKEPPKDSKTSINIV